MVATKQTLYVPYFRKHKHISIVKRIRTPRLHHLKIPYIYYSIIVNVQKKCYMNFCFLSCFLLYRLCEFSFDYLNIVFNDSCLKTKIYFANVKLL